MKIDYCLILAAGLGTRMGPVGQVLPKVLWPIFEKTLIELEIAYAKRLGIKKIFINLHFQHERIKDFIEKLHDPSISILEELPTILDVGGAVHNLARVVNYEGNLLIINSDQFLFFDPQLLHDAVQLLEKNRAVLFSIPVKLSGKYNKTRTDIKKNLKEIIPFKDVKDESYDTYSGCSVVNLNKLSKYFGASSFFQTVAEYQTQNIPMISLAGLTYWDFGTKQRYIDSMLSILENIHKNQKDEFINFLISEKALDQSKITKGGYNSEDCINLSSQKNISHPGSLILGGNSKPISLGPMIGFDNIWDKLI